MKARARAAEQADNEIKESQSRAIAQRKQEQRLPDAMEQMAARLSVSQSMLLDTLRGTVFKECNTDAQFQALVIVSNEYNLNPLLKEIYAFPTQKGIMPMVAYDGWIRIMNEHPQFDGFEIEHIIEDGRVIGAEGIVYRKDRSRPIKKTIYLDEFKMNTKPWNEKPSHMLDVRCLCHTVRIAFGVSAGVADDVEAAEANTVQIDAPKTLPKEEADYSQGGEGPETYNQTGMTQVDEETARQLDAEHSFDGEDADFEPVEEDEEEDEQEEAPDNAPPWQKPLTDIERRIDECGSTKELTKVRADYDKFSVTVPNPEQERVEGKFRDMRSALNRKEA